MASPKSTAVSRCRYENRIVEHKANFSRESETLDPTDVVNVAAFPAKREGAVDRKRFFVVGYELIS